MDVHRDFCEVAVLDGEDLQHVGRVGSSRSALLTFARSLSPADEIALENSSPARAVADILRPFVARVAVANPVAVKAISHAKVKTDRVDAAMLARLLAANMLPEVYFGDEQTRLLRRRVARHGALVKARTALKNEIHAVLHRTLAGKPPVSDLFGKRGRRWLAALPLPLDEGETIAGCLRQLDALNDELELIDRAIATLALHSDDFKRLMTIPGVDIITAAAVLAAIGDVKRFSSPNKLVSYLGLNPTVRQSGNTRPYHGHISKAGSAKARWALSEAAWSATKTAGPLRAFAQRVSARRGKNIASVAVARKLAVLAWHLLTKQQDYAYARPSMIRLKMRRLEIRAGAQTQKGRRLPGGPLASQKSEPDVAAHAEAAYRQLVKDWTAANNRKGAGAANGARSSKALKAQSRAAGTSPNPALRSGVTRTPANRRRNIGGMSNTT